MFLHDLFSHGVVMFAFEGWGAAIAIAATAVSAGVGAYSASEQAGAMGDAADANSYNALQERLLKKQMYDESRGSQGFASMPLFAKDASGNPIEPQLFADSLGTYNYFNQGTPAEQAARYSDITARYAPLQQGASRTAAGVFDGSLVQEAIDAGAPVEEARRGVATAKKQAGLEALQSTINSIKAIQQKRGFTGDSFGNTLLRTDITRRVNSEGAGDMAAAELANASDRADIKRKGITLRLGNLDLPYQMQQQDAAIADLPENLAIQQSLKRNQVFSPFRIGVGSGPQVNSMPLVTPVATDGQIAGQAIGSLASGVGNLAAAQYLANQNKVNTNPEYSSVGFLTTPTGGSQYNKIVGVP